MEKQKIRIAHSPDSDDAFMFYALATGKIDTGNFELVHELKDIETLNQAALQGTYEVSAVSIHGYAYFSDKYALLNTGGSMGEGYGPVIVSKSSSGVELNGKAVAVPGEKTSAYLALRLLGANFTHKVLPFDEIIPAVLRDEVDMGLVIHEGQIAYRVEGLQKVIDLGEWWSEEMGLPLPLGGNAVRRDLGADTIREISVLLRDGIRYSLENREAALEYATQFSRGLDTPKTDRFVSMYVNERTLDYGDDGREAIQLFLDKGFEAGLIPKRISVEFV